MTTYGFMTLHVQAAIAIARADVIEHSYALPRAYFVHAGPRPPIVVWPERPVGVDDRAMYAWFSSRLSDGRADLTEAIKALPTEAFVQLPGAARIVMTSMGMIPMHKRALCGAYVQIWNPHTHVTEALGVLPYIYPTTADDKPSLGDFELIGHVPGTQIETHLN